MNKKQSGFTLIELLVVIAIIGILAALVLVALGNARNKANDARIKSNIGQLRTLAEVFYDANGASYVNASGEDLAACYASAAAADCAGAVEGSIAALKADFSKAGSTDVDVVADDDEFCISANLKSDVLQFVCVDNTGAHVEGLAAVAQCGATAAGGCP
ncbi:MAG: type II secretion system protein [Candidatus Andersenbacteria bacterium]|nr:type II secretion system protein [Candidatus Andersenbacteria bacterium]